MIRKVIIAFFILWLKIKQLFSSKKDSKRLLIVKIDAIGDYILFRNFLKEIIDSPKYKGYKITLAGNILAKDLALELDNAAIDNFIHVNHKTLNRDWFKLFREITSNHFMVAINYHFSRTFVSDIICFVSSANKKIAMKGDNLNMRPLTKRLFNLCYSTVLNSPGNLKHEFDINKFLTGCLIGYAPKIRKPVIALTDKRFDVFIPQEQYVVLAPGTGVKSRQPNLEALLEITKFLSKKYNICFIGSANDSLIIQEIKNRVSTDQLNKIIDLTGKTPLSAVPYILNRSLCNICTDSAAYHISVALDKPTLCLAGGGHFDRFVKYADLENIRICYEPMRCFNCDWKCIYNFGEDEPYPCVSAISLSNIYENFNILEKAFSSGY